MKSQGLTLLELLAAATLLGLLSALFLLSLLQAQRGAVSTQAQQLARHAATLAEIKRSVTNTPYSSPTPCVPALLVDLPASVPQCVFRQDENTTYVLTQSSSGKFFLFDGKGLQGPLGALPASW
ncbi:prepilin-type N-terminal cleavage/methylation domain-containing protein [Deinococcus sp. YIM 77859]|uniref:prepilin-type N-terminal cleavage/methylation domain-containing protein n=1 Tax=Deinococcus sp. YIM 77859 TaxID=1540221 RepID=UPI0005583675|nr:prepilin-type N-terminal cleavage/methylation domain-containing protein [Deinococcus sp. YIM 77859]